MKLKGMCLWFLLPLLLPVLLAFAAMRVSRRYNYSFPLSLRDPAANAAATVVNQEDRHTYETFVLSRDPLMLYISEFLSAEEIKLIVDAR